MNLIRYHDVFNGEPLAVVRAEPPEVERWVRFVSKISGIPFDWKFINGVPHVMFRGLAPNIVPLRMKKSEYNESLRIKKSEFTEAVFTLFENIDSLKGGLELATIESSRPIPMHRKEFIPRPL